jgi:altronate hydrolase
MDTGVIRLHPSDNVVVALSPIPAGTAIASERVTTRDAIPFGHKIATRPIKTGEPVRKYGQVLGVATKDIAPGQHVHVQNVTTSDLRSEAEKIAVFKSDERPRSFQGYKRADGRVGTRNYIAVLTSVNCSATVAKFVAEQAKERGLLKKYPNIDGVVPIVHGSGCGMPANGELYDLLVRTLWGTANNPNFAAVLLVGLGCEVPQIARIQQDYAAQTGEKFQSYTIQDVGGTRNAVEEGLRRLEVLLPEANRAGRSEQPASELMVGLQCGASDAWSGVTGNPALGNACDRLVELGGTVILSETPEIYGAEHLLYARAAAPEIAAKLRERIVWWENYTRINNMEMNNNPSPGNKAGGLTTILEKSLGAVAKAGTSPLMEVVEYAKPITKHGLVYMDSPGLDPCSATGQVASGANLIAFTTGRGSAYGCKPTPTIKLATNSTMYAHMKEDMDINCGTIATGEATIAEKGAEILDLMIEAASGQRTKSELLGYGDMEFVPWHIGAVM